MKHKFWFSSMQWHGYHRCFVMTPEGEVEYTEWCSDGQNSNFEDAKLVYETDEQSPQIRVEGDIDLPFEPYEPDYIYEEELKIPAGFYDQKAFVNPLVINAVIKEDKKQ